MEILTPTQIGDEFEKTAKEVNEALAKRRNTTKL